MSTHVMDFLAEQSPKDVMAERSHLPHAGLMRWLNCVFIAVSILLLATLNSIAAHQPPPNIIYILCDDLGYGDVKCLNSQGKIPTPNMDRLAAGGMTFTDAHSSSAVCTPSRYSILTGRYNWRSRMKRGVLNGFSPRLIETNRVTVAAFLKEQGYTTACLGKWHLGMNWPQNDGKPPGSTANPKKIDYTQPIQGGPTPAGFDYSTAPWAQTCRWTHRALAE